MNVDITWLPAQSSYTIGGGGALLAELRKRSSPGMSVSKA